MKSNRKIEDFKFKDGEVYLFHTDDPNCPSDSSLWAQFFENNRIEAYTTDLLTFTLWKPLPTKYKYFRQATRQELRDFSTNYAYYEALQSLR